MIAPYQVAPPQGNLLGSIQNFIGQRRQMQMLEQDRAREQATMAAINAQMGYGSGVDPFGMQKFETGQSNLETASTQRGIAQGNFDMKKRDSDSTYNAASAIAESIAPGGANAGMYARPDMKMLEPGLMDPNVMNEYLRRAGIIEGNVADRDRYAYQQELQAKNAAAGRADEARLREEAQGRRDERLNQFDIDKENRALGRESDAVSAVGRALGWEGDLSGLPLGMIPDVVESKRALNAQAMANIMEMLKAATAQGKPEETQGFQKIYDDLNSGKISTAEAVQLRDALLQRQQEERALLEEIKRQRMQQGLTNLSGAIDTFGPGVAGAPLGLPGIITSYLGQAAGQKLAGPILEGILNPLGGPVLLK